MRLDGERSCAGLVVALGIGLGLAACGEGAPPREPAVPPVAAEPALAPTWRVPPAPTEQWCAECHEEVVESWSRTGMARALSPVDPAELVGLARTEDVPSGVAYEYGVDDAGRPQIVETSLTRPDYRHTAPLAYAVGAGEFDRAFVALQGAFEWFAPLEVLSLPGGRRPALAPGHMANPDQRFAVSITPECLGCHTESLPRAEFPMNLHRGLAGTESWEPRGISCAACHGAVERHASWQGAALAGEEPPGRDPILRPQLLDREQRMSICSACHLEGDVRIAFNSRAGPPRPGGDLLDQRAVFVAAESSSEIGFVSHTERLVQSPCYLESGTLDCATCHDPHRSLHSEPERLRVRAACLRCHPAEGADHTQPGSSRASPCARPQPAPATDGDCASCHMRKTPVYDVADVEIHDHLIRTRPGPPSPQRRPRTQEAPDGDWVRFTWPGQPPPTSVEDSGLWLMAFAHRRHTERALQLLDVAPGRIAAQLPMYHHTRGSLLDGAGRVTEAIAAYESAMTVEPGFAPSAINLGLLLALNGERERGLALLDDVLLRHPAAVNALRNRAGLRAEGGDLAGFVSDLTRAFELHPTAELASILAEFFHDAGDVASSAEWVQKGMALTP